MMSRPKESSISMAMDTDNGAADNGSATGGASRPQFSIPDLLQLYRQTLYMAVKEADLSAAGNPFGEDGLAEIRADLDNWTNIEFDPPGCLRLSKKSGACQKIVSYWKKLLGSILTDRDPSSFGNHDRGVMTICKLLHKDFQIAVTAISKWNERAFPNIPTDQVKEKLSMNQLTFLCRRYHNDLTLIAHAFKSSVSSNDFKFLNPRLTETYPINDEPEYEIPRDDNASSSVPAVAKPVDKRKRPSQAKHDRNSANGDSLGLSMASMYGAMDMEPRLAQFSDALHNSPLPSPIDPSKAFFLQSQHRRHPPAPASPQHQPVLKSLLPRHNGGQRDREQPLNEQPLDLGSRHHQSSRSSTHHPNGNGHSNGHGNANGGMSSTSRKEATTTTGRSAQTLEMENQRLRDKTKKYVGVIMNLVQQIVGSGQVPFVDLRCIDAEDREELGSGHPPSSSGTSSHQEATNAVSRHHNGSSNQNSSSHRSSYSSLAAPPNTPNQSPAPIPVRRRSSKQVSNASFDQASARWNNVQPNIGMHSVNGAGGDGSKRTTTQPTVMMSTLTSLLSEPVLGQYNPNKHFSVIQHSNTNAGSPEGEETTNGGGNGGNGLISSSKSKRKNNPVKRELPGYAPHVTSSPDAGGSDDAGSVGSGGAGDYLSASESSKSVKASIFTPPIDTNYVESRGVAAMKRSSPDDMTRQVVPSRAPSHGISSGSNKRKCSLQTMTDSLLFATGGLSALAAMPEALPTEVPDSVSGHWLSPGQCVFAQLQDGVLFPAHVVEKAGSNDYVLAWMHEDGFQSTVSVKEIFTLDEILTEKRAVMVKDGLGGAGSAIEDGDYHLGRYLDANPDGTYAVFANWGEVVGCHLQNMIVVPQDSAHQVLPGTFGSRYAQRENTHEEAFPSDTKPSSTVAQKSSRLQPLVMNSSLSHTCFLITWGSSSVLKGCDDQQLADRIRVSGGEVVEKFEDLVSFHDGKKFLVAPSTCATPEFFQCLAANIPCVSYQWVIDCHNSKARRDYEDYLLPAGIDKEEVVFWHPRDYMFGTRRIGLYSDSTEFIDSHLETWLLAFKAGGVTACAIEQDHLANELSNVEIVVVDGICPDILRETAEAAGVTVVNESWLKSCLIHGKVMDWDSAEFMPLFD